MIVILSYFHIKIGPSIFYSYPKRQLHEEIITRIYDLMDHPNKEQFLTQSFGNSKLLNYYFQIYSDWARGSEEMLMISIMINQQISPEIEESISNLCKEFSEKMESTEEIFTGFHVKELNKFSDDQKEHIIKNELLIKDWVRDLYWKIIEDTRKKSEKQKITLLLNDRYIFESLEMMSRELEKISKEINSGEGYLKANSEIKTSISNLNKIIDDLYERYIEKMTELDIEYENGLFSTEEEFDTDILKSKKEFLQALEGEFNAKKEKKEKKEKKKMK